MSSNLISLTLQIFVNHSLTNMFGAKFRFINIILKCEGFFLSFYVAAIQLMNNRINYEGISSINILDVLHTRTINRIYHFFILQFKIHPQSPDLFKKSNKCTLSVYPRKKWNGYNEHTPCLRFKIWQMVQSPFCFLGCAYLRVLHLLNGNTGNYITNCFLMEN